MTKPSETLIDLLKRTERCETQEITDEQNILAALQARDTTKAQTLVPAAQKDEETLLRTHAALLGAVVEWKTDLNKQLEALPFDEKFTLLEQGKPVVDHTAQLETVFEQTHSAFQAVLSFARNPTQDIDSGALLKQVIDLFTRWRDGAHNLAREIGALETFEEHIRKKLGERTKYEFALTDFSVDTSRELGEGASAFVYRATHIKTGQQYVLKYYKDLISFDAEKNKGLLSQAIERLVRVAHFNHPNLVSAKGFCLQKDQFGKLQLIAVLPLVEGTKLTKYLDQKNWSEADIRRFFDIVGPAVQYMIDNGVVHSDLAPRNVMVAGSSGNESYYLIDFENVQLLSKDVSRTNASADYRYSPIEVLLGRMQGETNTTIPFYALGKIGIRMAVGSESAFEELHNQLSSGEYLFPILVAKTLENRCTPQFIQTVCMATLPDIKDRFISWKLMREALEKGVAGKSLMKRFGAALKHLFTTPLGGTFSTASAILRGDRVIPKAPEYQIVAGENKPQKALPASTEKPEPATLPIPPPLMPMNVIGIRKIPGYFEVETEHEVYRLHAKRTDGGKSRYQDDWVTHFQGLGDETRLYTPAEILRIVVALRQRLDHPSDKTEKDAAEELKAELYDDFRNHWMMTGARIDYSKSKGDSVIQHYRNSSQTEINVTRFWGKDEWLSKLPDNEADMIAHSLFDADKEDVRNTFKWLTKKDSYVWRANSANDSQRPVVLGLGDDVSRFGIVADGDDLDGPARGVAVRKKN